ncbi:MAG: 2-hydroxymuconic semialdehyde dehydrogenase [Phycicoccus sp.]|nr:2-hydroxymuconic semialdehyde dehydrogenase [Phycicoccus sp.]
MSTWPTSLLRGRPQGEPMVLRSYVDGAFRTPTATFDKRSPVTGEVVFRVAETDRATLDKAVAAARRAQSGEWGSMGEQARATILRRLADELDRRVDDLVTAEIADTGKSVEQARTLDVPRGAANLRAFADVVAAQGTESFFTPRPGGDRALNVAIRKPAGVVAIIVPWNLPLLLATWKIAPALACGNAVIVKPSEETPASVTVLAEAFEAAGLPPGVFNLVHGHGPNAVGEWLTTHPGIDVVTFTGESATGSAIQKAAADTVKAVSFELGGKNAGLVFADADLDAAVAGSVRSSFTNGGQVCLCTERIYVHRSRYDEFTTRLAQQASELRWGWPDEHGIGTMPLISHEHRTKVLGYYDLARQEGASVLTGGGIPAFGDARDSGAYIEPTVITGLSQGDRTVREEIFGPITHVAPFDNEDEAWALANDSEYGLACAVWTRDIGRALRAGQALDVGLVWVNTWFLRDLRTPFGGMKASGVGREGGRHSLDFYSEYTTLCMDMA